jgi:hypothetical protein
MAFSNLHETKIVWQVTTVVAPTAKNFASKMLPKLYLPHEKVISRIFACSKHGGERNAKCHTPHSPQRFRRIAVPFIRPTSNYIIDLNNGGTALRT